MKGIPMCDLCTNGLYPGWDIKTEITTMKSINTPGWIFEYHEWKEKDEFYSKELISRYRFPDDFGVYFKILFQGLI